ncbi:MAG: DNA repair protein RecO [bacterium ADurb.BinA186]|nr:MAG: DNA repair protein RecO [bacterium ADurb.BinA186]
MLPEEEPAESIFLLIEGAWLALAQRGAQASILRAFEMHLLDFCGYLPDFSDVDGLGGGQIFYDPIACRLSEEPVAQSFMVTRSAIMLAKNMLESEIGQVENDNFDDLLSLGRIFRSRLSVLGIKELKSVSFMKQLAKK